MITITSRIRIETQSDSWLQLLLGSDPAWMLITVLVVILIAFRS